MVVFLLIDKKNTNRKFFSSSIQKSADRKFDVYWAVQKHRECFSCWNNRHKNTQKIYRKPENKFTIYRNRAIISEHVNRVPANRHSKLA